MRHQGEEDEEASAANAIPFPASFPPIVQPEEIITSDPVSTTSNSIQMEHFDIERPSAPLLSQFE